MHNTLKYFSKLKYVFLEMMIKFSTDLCTVFQLRFYLKVGYPVNKTLFNGIRKSALTFDQIE